jgi:hypothetical protein
MRWLRAAAQRLLNKAGKVEYQIRQARDRRAAPPPPPAEDATPD